jgi:hypothetical protein
MHWQLISSVHLIKKPRLEERGFLGCRGYEGKGHR